MITLAALVFMAAGTLCSAAADAGVWNVRARWFIEAPTLAFTNDAKAASYRFSVSDDRGKIRLLNAASAEVSLDSVWHELPTGYVEVRAEGVGADGKTVSFAGSRRFWKAEPFREGAYPPARRPYGEAAARIYDYLISQPHMRHLEETGEVDMSYALNGYPSKMHSAQIEALLLCARRRPQEKARLLRLARLLADRLIDRAEKPGSPLQFFTLTYDGGGHEDVSRRYADLIMLKYPAVAGLALLDFAEASGEAKYREHAVRIADTYFNLQGEDGAWYLKLNRRTGVAANPNRLVPTEDVIPFLERVFRVTGEAKYRSAAERAVAFVENGSVRTWNWDAQFEDVEPKAPYQNLTKHGACSYAIYLCERHPKDAERIALARRLLRFAEDQFVCWDEPYKGRGLPKGENRKDWNTCYQDWVYPCALEQYGYYVPIDASAAKLIRTYLALYRVTREPSDLAKARALGDAMTRAQSKSGRLRTMWREPIDDPHNGDDWDNCMVASAEALEELAAAVSASGGCDARAFEDAGACSPETWFHIVDGNATKEGLAADIRAIAEAGIGGIQLFHGGWAADELWPGVKEPIPCLSEKWADLIKFAETECHRRGLTFKMQNCPGWSMSGGPWITPDKAMRKLVAFEPGRMPKWNADDDYHEIGSVTFPAPDESRDGELLRVFPNPQQLNHVWAYEPKTNLWDRPCPPGAWQDEVPMTFARHGASRLDMWEAKAGWGLRRFEISTNETPVKTVGEKTLVFGHVNAKLRNAPAPANATGWECDKMDPRGFEANWNGYLGKLIKSGVKLDGTLVDSWECGCQTWTWKMEEEFEKRNGYALRPWLPALFGYVLKSEAATEKFLLDWRRTCSRLVEDNYYGTMARLAHENGMTIQFETAFGDVIPGDILRYWKYADEPMCEFWSPFDNDGGFVYSHDFKPVRPCVSAAHIYGKRRVSAEAFTSFILTFNESFQELKENANRHFARGVTHLVFHTYTHNPVIGGKPPGSSLGNHIGMPFLRLQPWWKYMPEFSRYLENCCRELERGLPAVDILWYLGDDLNHKPSESTDLFENEYKYDYCNNDALMTRIDAKDGWLVLPDGMSYRVLWIPTGTFLLPETEAKLAELEKKGARIVRGDLKPDWDPPLKAIGQTGKDVYWYQRRDEGQDVFFVAERGSGQSAFVQSVKMAPQADHPTGATERVYVGAFSWDGRGEVELSLGKVCHWATVKVNGRIAARLWCKPYSCDITKFVTKGENRIEVEVTSTIYNQLVLDAARPEAERATWTIAGPKDGAPLADAGLYGPVVLKVVK